MKRKVKYQPQFFQVKLHIYPFDIFVSVNQTHDTFIESVNEHEIKAKDIKWLTNFTQDGAKTYFSKRRGIGIIRMYDFDNSPESISHLSHEVLHIVDLVLRGVGCKLRKGSDEAYTYLMQYLMESILKEL